MPYLQHFDLTTHPFGLTPNLDLYCPNEGQDQVLRSVIYAVERGEGITKIVGEVGTGKTMLSRLLIRKLIENGDTVGYLNQPGEDKAAIVSAIYAEFQLDAEGGDVGKRLTDFLLAEHAAGRRVVVVIDEAQALGQAGLETVRRLSNLETDTAKLMQIVLFGQPELDRLLGEHALRQVNQRIAFSFSLGPLGPQSVRAYILHRMENVARNRMVARALMTEDAIRLIAQASGGIPRLINILGDKALMAAYGQSSNRVREAHVEEAVADSRVMIDATRPEATEPPRVPSRQAAGGNGPVMAAPAAQRGGLLVAALRGLQWISLAGLLVIGGLVAVATLGAEENPVRRLLLDALYDIATLLQ